MMIEEYLNKRQVLKGIVMLVDIRHEPGENDKIMYNWLKHYDYDIIVVATKMDKIKRSQIQKQLSVIKKGLNMAPEDTLIPFSGETKVGVEELWSVLENIIGSESNETKNSSVGFQYDDRRSMRRTRRKFRHGRFVYSDCSSTLVYNVSCGYAACVYNIVGYPSQRDKINKNGVIFYTVFSIP